MPNWADGTLKLRGTRKNIKRFLHEGLVRTENETSARFIQEDDWAIETMNQAPLYIKNTTRALITSTLECNFRGKDDSDIEILYADSMRQAWDIMPDEFQRIARTYDLDIRIYAYECGMQFNRLVEIIDGEITRNETYKFNDYEWESIEPYRGG